MKRDATGRRAKTPQASPAVSPVAGDPADEVTDAAAHAGMAEGARMDDTAGIAALLDAANDLKHLPRMGWLLAGVRPAESVADHTTAVALLALALADVVNRDAAAQGLAHPLQVERVLRIALLHDLAESHVTDLPKRATELLGEAAKHDAEARALTAILAGYTQMDEWLACWQEYDANATPEARLVRDADKLEMLHQALRYRQAGNQRLDEFLTDRTWAFPLCAALRTHLLARA